MNKIEPGCKVAVICRHGSYSSDGAPMPPVGAVGVVTSEIDEYGECDVLFEEYPCPVDLPDPSWILHWTLLVRIDGNPNNAEVKREEKVFW